MTQMSQIGEFWERLVEVAHAIVVCATCQAYSKGDPASPQPTFVGPRYDPGGVMFVASNPGVSPSDWGSTRDRRYAELKDEFRAAPSVERYARMVAEMHAQMQGLGNTGPQRWRAWVHPVSKCIEGCLTPSDIGWGNVSKHRTPGDSVKDRPLTSPEWNHGIEHLNAELQVLRPGAVVAMGVTAAKALEALNGSWKLMKIKARGATTADAFSIRDAIRTMGPRLSSS